MMMTHPNDDMLDDLFAKVSAERATPDDALLARVLADAAVVQAGFAAPRPAAPARGLWGRMMDTIGGWPSLGGLTAATVAGVWIGVAPPASLSDVTVSFLGEELSVPLVPGDLGLETGVFADG